MVWSPNQFLFLMPSALGPGPTQIAPNSIFGLIRFLGSSHLAAIPSLWFWCTPCNQCRTHPDPSELDFWFNPIFRFVASGTNPLAMFSIHPLESVRIIQKVLKSFFTFLNLGPCFAKPHVPRLCKCQYRIVSSFTYRGRNGLWLASFRSYSSF